MKARIFILAGIISLALCACTAEKPAMPQEQSGDAQTSESQDSIEQEPADDFHIQAELTAAEEQAAALETKLREDASLTQADINDISYEIYVVWDTLMNNIWQSLNVNLDEDRMDVLLSEQQEWLTEKEEAAKQAGEALGGGSMASMASNQKAAELTKERVYELAAYLE